ncbi:hypothetical protein [Mobilicoccus caccae]|uniref:Uncharacterized protein n=1 Tax=Mobilicoccus caccae TaxID=1859295 RepID=A0ABQ6IPV0_9MICO|nr:hypothetical protein GCM10025883_19870 [Mobilicoccus caccae]
MDEVRVGAGATSAEVTTIGVGSGAEAYEVLVGRGVADRITRLVPASATGPSWSTPSPWPTWPGDWRPRWRRTG